MFFFWDCRFITVKNGIFPLCCCAKDGLVGHVLDDCSCFLADMLLPCEEGRISENKETGGCRQKGPGSVKESSAVKLPATSKFLAHRIAVEAVGTFLGRLSCTKLNSTGTHPSGPLDLVEPAPPQHPRSHRMRPARPIEVRNTWHETRARSHARRQRSSAIAN